MKNQLSRVLICFSAFFLFSQSAYSATTGGLYIGAGALAQNVLKTSGNDKAGTAIAGAIMPEVGLLYTTGGAMALNFEAHYTPLGKQFPDDSAKGKVLAFALPLSFGSGALQWKAGPGYLMYIISGSGGTAVLANGGGGATSTFSKPSGTRTSKTLFVDLGLAYRGDLFRLDLDAWIEGALSSRRSFSVLAQLSFELF